MGQRQGVLCTFVVEPGSNCECDVAFARLIETVCVAQFTNRTLDSTRGHDWEPQT